MSQLGWFGLYCLAGFCGLVVGWCWAAKRVLDYLGEVSEFLDEPQFALGNRVVDELTPRWAQRLVLRLDDR